MNLDHLVYATPDLAGTVAELRGRGIGLVPGGAHPGRGTRNHLAGLADGAYLEVIGPDPEQDAPDGPRWFGIDDLTAPRLVTWAIRVPDLGAARERSGAAGYPFGDELPMSRRRPDGALLSWSLAFPRQDGGVVPFLIDWQESPHPAESLPGGVTLVSLTGVHPDPGLVAGPLAALGAALTVVTGPGPRLEAVLATPGGEVVLR
ncbi:VOC family protein [Amycolatopsis thermalba]|uniref:VOC family protein n=1 Tax=Amycolatopsis thermalba TaxID=944492 RepID=UPI000E251CFD|nr:VOC family protein [Amycolatopsis thermalba]